MDAPYVDSAYADTYFEARLDGDVWASLSFEAQGRALQSATDALDAYAARCGGWRKDYAAAPPDALRRACCLEAIERTRPEAQARRRAQRQGVRAISIGGASESYADAPGAELLCEQAMALVRPYIRFGGAAIV